MSVYSYSTQHQSPSVPCTVHPLHSARNYSSLQDLRFNVKLLLNVSKWFGKSSSNLRHETKFVEKVEGKSFHFIKNTIIWIRKIISSVLIIKMNDKRWSLLSIILFSTFINKLISHLLPAGWLLTTAMTALRPLLLGTSSSVHNLNNWENTFTMYWTSFKITNGTLLLW